MRSFFRKLLWLKQRKSKEEDLREEIQFHLDEEAVQLETDGLAPSEARWAAHRSLGNVGLVNEQVREMWGWIRLERFTQDLRYAWRGLFRSPAFTAVSILSLALGIGATVVVFSVFEAVFLDSVTAKDADRIRHIEIGNGRVSYHGYEELLAATPMLSGLAAYDQVSLSLNSGNHSEKVSGEIVSANFFSVLGATTWLGRGFSPTENRPGGQPRVAVVSNSFWTRHFNADPNVLGTAIELNGEPYVVVGVLSKGYRSIQGYGISPEVYVPISPTLFGERDNPHEQRLELIGHMSDGVNVPQAQASIYATILRMPELVHGDNQVEFEVKMYPLSGIEKMRRDGVPIELAAFFGFLLFVAALVLLIACANVAGLLLARGLDRSHEIAVRLALGAARYRLVQQLLTESFMLAILGSGAGIAFYLFASKLIDKIQIRVAVPLELHVVLDARLLVFAIALALVAALISGLAPAVQASRSNWHLGSNRIGANTRRSFSLRRSLVAGQFALSFVLLVSAALFARSLVRMSEADPGFDSAHLLTAEVNLYAHTYSQAKAERYFETAINEIGRLPGVRFVSGAAVVPLGLDHWVMSLKADDHIIPRAHVNTVTPGYFQTMGIALLRGRDFQVADRANAPAVAIVNAFFARKYLNNNAIGKEVLIPHDRGLPGAQPAWSRAQVIGVVADSKYGSLGEDPIAALYWPYSQQYRALAVIVNFDHKSDSPFVVVGDILGRLDPDVGVSVQFMQDRLASALLPSRIASVLLNALGSLGLILAAIGIYGVMAFTVSRRSAEFGVRFALGATQKQVLLMIFRDALGVAAMGMGTGLAMALLLTRPLAMVLAAGISLIDPFSYAAVGLLLIIVALIAATIPAWRASKADPIRALRYE